MHTMEDTSRSGNHDVYSDRRRKIEKVFRRVEYRGTQEKPPNSYKTHNDNALTRTISCKKKGLGMSPKHEIIIQSVSGSTYEVLRDSRPMSSLRRWMSDITGFRKRVVSS